MRNQVNKAGSSALMQHVGKVNPKTLEALGKWWARYLFRSFGTRALTFVQRSIHNLHMNTRWFQVPYLYTELEMKEAFEWNRDSDWQETGSSGH